MIASHQPVQISNPNLYQHYWKFIHRKCEEGAQYSTYSDIDAVGREADTAEEREGVAVGLVEGKEWV